MQVRQTSSPLVRLVMASSRTLLAVERIAVMTLMFLLTALVLLNVVSRYTGRPIYWVDESSVYSVVWMTFIGASAMTRMRLDFAVTLLTDRLSEANARRFKIVAGLGVVGFGLSLAAMCWLWLDPMGIARAGFDAKEYAGQSFNFIYTERTQTLNWPTWVLYLIMPLFAVCMTIHGLANVFEDLGWAAREQLPAFTTGNAEGVVN